MKRRLFKINNWTKLERTVEQKNNVLLSLFSVLGIGAAGLQVIIDTISQIYLGVVMDFIILATVITTYILNERGKHFVAKLLFVGLLNSILFLYANIVPKSIGVYLYFFPVIGVAALIFDHKNSITRNVFITLPIILVLLLELSDYHFFGNINIQAGVNDIHSFPINLFISLTVSVISIYQMVSINRGIDEKRLMIANELKDKNEDLEKSNTELDHFVYSTSHDLKAPLSSISGLINIARYDVKEPKALEYFGLIDNRVDKLNAFIKDIIDLSRNSRLDLALETIDIKEIIDNVIENNRYMENANSIRFETYIPTNSTIVIDRARLEIVLNNLISNAIKYHKKEGDRFIKISILRARLSLKITVKDNGIGVAKFHHKKVFDMFYRGHEDSEGSGLGLYIVKDIVNKMKGEITLNSDVGKGVEIKVVIPIS